MTYEVVTFASATDGSVARIRMPMPTKAQRGGSAMKLDWLPVAIHAPTCDEARAKAVAFYESELERLSTKAENMARGREKAAASRKAKEGEK